MKAVTTVQIIQRRSNLSDPAESTQVQLLLAAAGANLMIANTASRQISHHVPGNFIEVPNIFNVQDVRTIQRVPAHHFGFSAKSPEHVGVEVIQGNLNDDFIIVPCVQGFPDLSHSAIAQTLDHSISFLNDLVGCDVRLRIDRANTWRDRIGSLGFIGILLLFAFLLRLFSKTHLSKIILNSFQELCCKTMTVFKSVFRILRKRSIDRGGGAFPNYTSQLIQAFVALGKGFSQFKERGSLVGSLARNKFVNRYCQGILI